MKKNINTFKKIILVAIATSTIVSCERNSTYENTKPSIANIAVTNSAFSTLEAAAVLGGVAGVLSNPNPGDASGNYTVFAPTNDAFAKLGLNPDTLGALNPTFLTNTLLYHVSNGDLMSGSFLPATPTASALGGLTRRFIEKNGEKYINGSKIVITNVSAANGTVHAIDKVMIATGADIVDSALAVQSGGVFVKPELTYLVEAVVYAGLAGPTSPLRTAPSLTVFAPTDQAFINLGKALNLTFTKPSDLRQLTIAQVTAVLTNHVIGGGKFTPEMTFGANSAFGGQTLTIGEFVNGVVTIKGANTDFPAANMVIPDIQAKNGVIHIVDSVIMPTL
jgi:uncharacterized surface protein with fasciclin (FAS1) repeats